MVLSLLLFLTATDTLRAGQLSTVPITPQQAVRPRETLAQRHSPVEGRVSLCIVYLVCLFLPGVLLVPIYDQNDTLLQREVVLRCGDTLSETRARRSFKTPPLRRPGPSLRYTSLYQ